MGWGGGGRIGSRGIIVMVHRIPIDILEEEKEQDNTCTTHPHLPPLLPPLHCRLKKMMLNLNKYHSLLSSHKPWFFICYLPTFYITHLSYMRQWMVFLVYLSLWVFLGCTRSISLEMLQRTS